MEIKKTMQQTIQAEEITKINENAEEKILEENMEAKAFSSKTDINISQEAAKDARDNQELVVPEKLKCLDGWREKVKEERPFDRQYTPIEDKMLTYDENADRFQTKLREFWNDFEMRSGNKSESFKAMPTSILELNYAVDNLRKVWEKTGVSEGELDEIRKKAVNEVDECYKKAVGAVDNYINTHGITSFKGIRSEGRARMKLAREFKKMVVNEGEKLVGKFILHTFENKKDAVGNNDDPHRFDEEVMTARINEAMEAIPYEIDAEKAREYARIIRQDSDDVRVITGDYPDSVTKIGKSSKITSRCLKGILNKDTQNEEQMRANVEIMEAFKNGDMKTIEKYVIQIATSLLNMTSRFDLFISTIPFKDTYLMHQWWFMWSEFPRVEEVKNILQTKFDPVLYEILSAKGDVLSGLGLVREDEIMKYGYSTTSGVYSENNKGSYERDLDGAKTLSEEGLKRFYSLKKKLMAEPDYEEKYKKYFEIDEVKVPVLKCEKSMEERTSEENFEVKKIMRGRTGNKGYKISELPVAKLLEFKNKLNDSGIAIEIDKLLSFDIETNEDEKDKGFMSMIALINMTDEKLQYETEKQEQDQEKIDAIKELQDTLYDIMVNIVPDWKQDLEVAVGVLESSEEMNSRKYEVYEKVLDFIRQRTDEDNE